MAILTNEADAQNLEQAIDQDATRVSYQRHQFLETAMVLESRLGEAATRELDLLIQRVPIQIRPIDQDQLEWVRFAFHTVGVATLRN